MRMIAKAINVGGFKSMLRHRLGNRFTILSASISTLVLRPFPKARPRLAPIFAVGFLFFPQGQDQNQDVDESLMCYG